MSKKINEKTDMLLNSSTAVVQFLSAVSAVTSQENRFYFSISIIAIPSSHIVKQYSIKMCLQSTITESLDTQIALENPVFIWAVVGITMRGIWS